MADAFREHRVLDCSWTMEDDRVLVEALKANKTWAPAALLDRYQRVVFGLCFRMLRHRQDAEDVTQETFLRALRSVQGFDVVRPLRPWLLGIAANRCRTALGRRSRRPKPIEGTEERPDHRLSLTDPDDLGTELVEALNRLRPNYRLVFILYHEQGLPYDEIGRVIKRPIGTVKTWLHRARATLADDLSRRGLTPD